jgi:rhamnosyltransferase
LKRIGIFVFFDEEGIVDSYKEYYVSELKKCIDELHIIVNGEISDEGHAILSKFGEITIRPNEGLDITAYRETIDRLGQEYLQQFDELVMCNDTVFGPLYPFLEVFDEMESRNVGFWGLTKGYKDVVRYKKEIIKYGDHIHSYFMVVGQAILNDVKFYQFWNDLIKIESYNSAVFDFEVRFTPQLVKMGYKYDVLVNTEDIKHMTSNPLAFLPLELMRERKCPVFKRRYFYNNVLEFSFFTISNAMRDSFDYVENETDYDVNFIWDTILRNGEPYNIWKQLCLTYILPEDYIIPQTLDLNVRDNSRLTKAQDQKVCAAVHIYRPEMVNFMIEKLKNLPEYVDIFVTTDTHEKKQLFSQKLSDALNNKIEIIQVENRGRSKSAFLVSLAQIVLRYDLCVVLHDKDSPAEGSSITMVTEGHFYKMYECLIKSRSYIENIIQTFDKNDRLGMLVTPESNHSFYDSTFADLWTVPDNLLNTQEVLTRVGVNRTLSKKTHPLFAFGGMFWVRTKSLKKLLGTNWSYSDFPAEPIKKDGTLLHAIERSYTYITQDAGYYTGFIMPSKFAALEYGNIKNSLLDIYQYSVREIFHTQELDSEIIYTHFQKTFKLLKSELDSIKNSKSYKLGVILTALPRAVLKLTRFLNNSPKIIKEIKN